VRTDRIDIARAVLRQTKHVAIVVD